MLEMKQGGQKQVIDEIETYMRLGGGEYEDWYVGITDSPLEPFTEAILYQKVQSEMFLFIETSSPNIAQAVADYFINGCGTDGCIDLNKTNRDQSSLYVYKKAVHLVC